MLKTPPAWTAAGVEAEKNWTSPISSSWVVMVRFPPLRAPPFSATSWVASEALPRMFSAPPLSSRPELSTFRPLPFWSDRVRSPTATIWAPASFVSTPAEKLPDDEVPLAWTVRSPSDCILPELSMSWAETRPEPATPAALVAAPNTITPVLARSPATVSWLAPEPPWIVPALVKPFVAVSARVSAAMSPSCVEMTPL